MAFSISRGRVEREDGQPLRTKIVATIGSEATYHGIVDRTGKPLKKVTYRTLVENFVASGADVIRLNLSHVPVHEVTAIYSAVREAILACERGMTDKRIAVLADLAGPKIRFNFESGVKFVVGAAFTVRFTRSKEGDDAGLVYVNEKPLKETMALADHRWPKSRSQTVDPQERKIFENILGARLLDEGQTSTFDVMMSSIHRRIAAGQDVLIHIGDGQVVLRVDSAHANHLACRVVTVRTTTLRGKKGFTIKHIPLEIPSFTGEDQQKLDRLLECENADPGSRVLAFVALSFVQTARDVLRVKYHIEKKWPGQSFTPPAIIAKIESESGWLNRDYILDVADGLMVARGDLGLQMEIENVIAIQKRLIQLCNRRGKPVITASEMLRSMIYSIEPTRAEGSDVFNAVVDGSDALMMSEETSAGRFPFHAILKMISLIDEAERYAEMKGMDDADRQRTAYRQDFDAFFLDAQPMIEQNRRRMSEIAAFLSGNGGELFKSFDVSPAEIEWYHQLYLRKARKAALQRTTDRIALAACTLSEAEEIKAILAATSGRTIRMIARMKPRVPVIGAARDALTTRTLIISHGVWPLHVGESSQGDRPEDVFQRCWHRIATDERLRQLLREAEVIFATGSPLEEMATTNLTIRMITENAPDLSPSQHVFISYVRENREQVDRLVAALDYAGVKVWLDRNEIGPGRRWRVEIRKAIREGAFFLACFSNEYAKKDRTYMNEELTLAIEELRSRRYDRPWFIPIRFDTAPIPARMIDATEDLSDLQWGDLSSDWHSGVARLLATIRGERSNAAHRASDE